MNAEFVIDVITELHRLQSQAFPLELRNGYCVECSNIDKEIYVTYPCPTMKAIKDYSGDS